MMLKIIACDLCGRMTSGLDYRCDTCRDIDKRMLIADVEAQGWPQTAAALRTHETALRRVRQALAPRGPYPMCRDPKGCAGRGYCPRDPACNE
jgi:hypothetical protein